MFNLLTGTLRMTLGPRASSSATTSPALAQRTIARLGIARTFQHVKLRPSMSLLDNVALGAHARGRAGVLRGALRLDRAEERRIAAEALRQLERVGLGERAHELAGSLPLGTQRILEVAPRARRRSGAARARRARRGPAPRREGRRSRRCCARLRDEGVTILIVEHDMDFVMGLVDRLVVMDFGSKLVEGAPAAVRADPRVQEAYLGRRGAADGRSLEIRVTCMSPMARSRPCAACRCACGRARSSPSSGRTAPARRRCSPRPMGLLPARGTLRLRGRADLAGLDVEARVERGLCLVPEQRELFGDLSVADNLLLGAYSRRLGRAELRAAPRRRLSRASRASPSAARRRASTLSGGERQMLALGRALMASAAPAACSTSRASAWRR